MKRLLILILVLGFASSVAAEVPKLVSYSGKLVNKSGQIVADGSYNMQFSLWTAESGGTQRWAEAHDGFSTPVKVSAGSFHVVLGSIDPTNNPLPDFSETLWLQISVEIDSTYEVFGRQELLSVPYALKVAQDAVLPVGTIVAWHKNLYNKLPPDWLECNGGTVPYGIGSPIEGQSIPNLNYERRFLRGDTTSGTTQEDALQNHHHYLRVNGMYGSPGNPNFCPWGNEFQTVNAGNGEINNVRVFEPKSDGETPVRVADETRPKNMSVVYIIKVK